MSLSKSEASMEQYYLCFGNTYTLIKLEKLCLCLVNATGHITPFCAIGKGQGDRGSLRNGEV